MNQVIPAGQYVQVYNREACYYMSMSNTCQCEAALKSACRKGKGCVKWLHQEECEHYVNNNDAVPVSRLPKKLRELIQEHPGQMVFVEPGDPRFTEADLQEIANFVALTYPVLASYVSVDWSDGADTAITVFQGIDRILVDKKFHG